MNFKQFCESIQNVLYIMRGIAGSGKSTLAHKIQAKEGGVIYSTDTFHIKNGKYQFNSEMRDTYHLWNVKRTAEAIKRGISPIFVDNTNVKFEYAEPYVKEARKHGYEIRVIEPNTPWAFNAEELTKRTKHDVPRDVIDQMIADWEPHDKFMVQLKRYE